MKVALREHLRKNGRCKQGEGPGILCVSGSSGDSDPYRSLRVTQAGIAVTPQCKYLIPTVTVQRKSDCFDCLSLMPINI